MSLDETFIKAFQAHRAAGDLFHDDPAKAHEVFQASTVSALLEGVLDGQTTFAELARHGDFGLGTFNALDGEMTALDGEFFQATSDGRVNPVDPAMKTPFAVMIFFEPTVAIDIDTSMDLPGLANAVDGAIPGGNIFYAIKAAGRFEQVTVRSVPRQSPPYPSLVEAVAEQPVFDHRDIDGTLIGFRFPDYTQGLNVPGYHLHFLSNDRTVGGHVMRFTTRRARVEIDITSRFQMSLPHDMKFLAAHLSKDSSEAIRKSET